MGEALLWLFRIMFAVEDHYIESGEHLPKHIEAQCPNFGILSPGPDFTKAKVENDPTKIWVKTAKGVLEAVPAHTATDALKINTAREMREFMAVYERICGKGQPSFYDIIPHVEKESLRACLDKANANRYLDPRAESKCYEDWNSRGR
ncbi:hypothetical protein [Leptospira licerasiae]|uniref:hypothetical protein n=1 Tax=Leptospira licerasiae TaxID=447106 RepID=UPI0010841EC0|nr:hypothetical protein [Leptospira licerasiae]TGM88509.1 hypothetical protein EHR05_13605 [Leptospira licerasiae]